MHITVVKFHLTRISIDQLGVANYSVQQTEERMQISEDKRYVKPTVYQGQYNLLCRRPEQDLIPTLRKYGMVYNAYR